MTGIIIPLFSLLVLLGFIGMQESLAEEEIIWKNSVTTSNDKIIATLATDKKEYSEGETIHIQWSLENLGSKDIFFKPTIVDSCIQEFDLDVFGPRYTAGKYRLYQLMPISGITSEPFACPLGEYPPIISPNEKIENEFSWTQDTIKDSTSFDGAFEKIPSGYYTLRITYYESEQQYNGDRPDYLDLGIKIERTSPTEGFFAKKLDSDLEFFHKKVNSEYYDVSMNYWTNSTITINDISSEGLIGSTLTMELTALEDGVLYLQPQDELAYLLVGGCPKDEYASNYGIEFPADLKIDGEYARPYSDYIQTVNSDTGFLTFGIFVKRGVEEIILQPPIGALYWGSSMQACAEKITTLLLTPYQQMKNGVLSIDVMCKPGFKIVKRTSNNFPTCILSSSINELEERGWGTSLLHLEGIDQACRIKGATNFDAECS